MPDQVHWSARFYTAPVHPQQRSRSEHHGCSRTAAASHVSHANGCVVRDQFSCNNHCMAQRASVTQVMAVLLAVAKRRRCTLQHNMAVGKSPTCSMERSWCVMASRVACRAPCLRQGGLVRPLGSSIDLFQVVKRPPADCLLHAPALEAPDDIRLCTARCPLTQHRIQHWTHGRSSTQQGRKRDDDQIQPQARTSAPQP